MVELVLWGVVCTLITAPFNLGFCFALRWLARSVGGTRASSLENALLSGMIPVFFAAVFVWTIATWEMRSGPANQSVFLAVGIVVGLMLIVWPITYYLLSRTKITAK